jgi:hypothetical protein
VLGPLQEQETEPTYSVLYSYVVHVQSKKSDYDDGTPALAFHHQDVLGSQVTGILPRGLVTLFGHVVGIILEQELYQVYKMRLYLYTCYLNG